MQALYHCCKKTAMNFETLKTNMPETIVQRWEVRKVIIELLLNKSPFGSLYLEIQKEKRVC